MTAQGRFGGGRGAWTVAGGALTLSIVLGATALAQQTRPAPAASAMLATELEADAALFVIERFLDGGNTVQDVAPLYADTVRYFDRGVETRDSVLRDKAAYFERWPERRFEPDLSTLSTREIGGPDGRRDVEVAMEVDFDVAGGDRSASGRSRLEMVLAPIGDGFIILAERGRVVSRPSR